MLDGGYTTVLVGGLIGGDLVSWWVKLIIELNFEQSTSVR